MPKVAVPKISRGAIVMREEVGVAAGIIVKFSRIMVRLPSGWRRVMGGP